MVSLSAWPNLHAEASQLRGKIVDSGEAVLAGAEIVLSAPDKLVVARTISDADGEFTLDAPLGEYEV